MEHLGVLNFIYFIEFKAKEAANFKNVVNVVNIYIIEYLLPCPEQQHQLILEIKMANL